MAHEYGGWWSDEKVERLRRYLEKYLDALKNRGFRRIYIDAFAGTGSRQTRRAEQQLDLGITEVEGVKKGSARAALELEPPFDEYVFVEKSRQRFAELRSLTSAYPNRQILFLKGDANQTITELCATVDWRDGRAVMFLDPYGLQVDWSTIEAIARTEAVDLWYLVPTGIGLSRVMAKHGKLPRSWETRLDRMLGDSTWRNSLYSTRQSTDLFGHVEVEHRRDAVLADIEEYFLDRLRSVFGNGVANRVLRLGPRKQALYMLTFACANPRGTARQIALRIANAVLK